MTTPATADEEKDVVERLREALTDAQKDCTEHAKDDDIGARKFLAGVVDGLKKAVFIAARLRSQGAAVPEGWRDISTAPRDGTVVDLWAIDSEYPFRKNDHRITNAVWRDDFWGWGPNRDGQNMLGKLWMEIRAAIRSGQGGAS